MGRGISDILGPGELYIRDMIWGGVWGALALFLPLLFHPFGLGALLMPLFLPLLIAGCTLHLRVSLVLALFIPLISSLFTGMPPLYPPVALLMVLEGLGMNLWLFLVYQKGRVNIYLSLAGAFLVQRAVRVIVILLAREVIPIPASWLLIPALLWGLPGAIIQVGVIPWIVKTISNRDFGVSAGTIGEEDSHRITG
ncbi:MAG: hypothetical protein RAO92_03050 [Candidatus Euphemobacter frigidus]|nr:hypothetical protein [Candidatus Euphemobacter frigidus]MDP8275357.1 hypothetical protein [Candidatus Euphemobacter frigidus]